MLYSYTHTATVGVKGLMDVVFSYLSISGLAISGSTHPGRPGRCNGSLPGLLSAGRHMWRLWVDPLRRHINPSSSDHCRPTINYDDHRNGTSKNCSRHSERVSYTTKTAKKSPPGLITTLWWDGVSLTQRNISRPLHGWLKTCQLWWASRINRALLPQDSCAIAKMTARCALYK